MCWVLSYKIFHFDSSGKLIYLNFTAVSKTAAIAEVRKLEHVLAPAPLPAKLTPMKHNRPRKVQISTSTLEPIFNKYWNVSLLMWNFEFCLWDPIMNKWIILFVLSVLLYLIHPRGRRHKPHLINYRVLYQFICSQIN